MKNIKAVVIFAIAACMKQMFNRFYEHFAKNTEEHEWNRRVHRLLAYHIILRNINEENEEFKKFVQNEVELLLQGEESIH